MSANQAVFPIAPMARVLGVSINFDGALSAIRADSTYLIDPTLRLQGTMQTNGGGNAGFDFHPLKGFTPTRYSFHVNGPWCVTFEFNNGEATKVDFEQYH